MVLDDSGVNEFKGQLRVNRGMLQRLVLLKKRRWNNSC